MTGGAAGRDEEATGRQGKSMMDVVSRRRRYGETSVAGVGDEVPVVDHKDRCWMLDWVGGIREPSSGLVLYVVIKDNIVPIGGVVKWSGGNSQFAMSELTMVLNARGHEPVVHASTRISKPKSVLSSSLEAAPSSKPIIIDARPPPSLRTTVAATRVPKSGQIGEKGPYRGQIVPSAPVKRRSTLTKEPVSLVPPPRYELVIPAGSHYFGDDDEENSEEDWERDEEREEYEEGGGEEKVESEHTISERGGPSELEGRLGVEYEDEGQEEETTGEGGYADVHWGSKRTQLLVSGHGHWEADPGRGEMHRKVGVEPVHVDAVRLAEKKRKNMQERRSTLDSKKTKQEGGAKQEEGKHKLKTLAVEEAVQRTREAEEAMKKKRQPRKKAAKGGMMEKTSVFPLDQPQSDEDAVGKTVTRPPGLQILSPGNSSRHLSKGFFLEFDENGNQRPEMQFITVKLDRILDIPDEEFRYNQRFLDQELIDDLYKTMIESDPSSAEQVANILALVRRERKPKMLTDVVEKNFLPSKWKMAGMDPPEKVVYDGMERESNAMVETLEHFCPADEAVVFLGKGHAGLVWELLKSHRHCIVLEGEGMKFEFLTQFIDNMVKTRDYYYANFTKPSPRYDEGRDLVYKVDQNMVNIWEFLFETKLQDRGEQTYALRRKVEKLLRGYHKAPSEREVSFLDRLETMYFDQQIGVFTIAGYATCFVDDEDFDADDSEEESVDGTLQATLAAERQKACSPASQRMGVQGTSSGSEGASSMAVSTDQLMTQPPTSFIVTPTQMAGNTMTVASRDSLDPNLLAMLSPELMATLTPFAHNPSTIMELLRSRTPQQPPFDEPLEYEIGDTIPADIRLLPGPIVCRDDYTVTDDATWGPSGSGSTVEGSQGPQETERKGSGSSGGSTVEGSHRRVEHDSGLALERSWLDQAKKLTVESNPTVGSETIAGATGKASGPRGAVQLSAVLHLSKGHTVVSNMTLVQHSSVRGLTKRRNSLPSRTRQWDWDQSPVQVARLQDKSTLFHLSKGHTVEPNTTGVHYWNASSLTERRNSWLSPTRHSNGDRLPMRVPKLRDEKAV
ncbi:hypothetical protein CBR_g50120 [Chara braunii]|uniref:Uncharacterized protein n=1 Tax=Chara braunii TaxID=69332 RepID=A0A388M609_CHABU|nr:hypothetical protein CBR_g50120 [Chara braunii]|eukprot:GBG90027.1 hypothetical protein CBR_g50120 [Chara braunii]